MRKLSVAIAAASAVFAASVPARADDNRGVVDWARVFVQLDTYARTGTEHPQAVTPRSERPATTSDPYVQNAGNAWFGVAPRVAIVARDWATAYRLAGDRLSLIDAMRLSASTRMVMTRVRLGDLHHARVTPFAQLGLGQWRTDTNLLPLTPRSTEIASQLGGGVEVHVTPSWQLAAESTMTAMIRDQREADSLPQTRLWSVMLASRLEF
jgi:hypothetical protein